MRATTTGIRRSAVLPLLAFVLVAALSVSVASAPAAPDLTAAPERLEIDVSTRNVAVTSNFTGKEIIVFGTVENSRQVSAESGFYDVVVIVEGTKTPLVARKKSNVAGLWINTSAIRFASLPSYYAIASTRPVDEIADVAVMDKLRIGFRHVQFQVASKGPASGIDAKMLDEVKGAIVRLKRKEGLYASNDYNVAFIGRSLFRAAVELPANIPVGPIEARVYLFRSGELLSEATVKLALERAGAERYLHAFAYEQPLLYGLFCVAVAVGAGLLGASLFRKGAPH